MNIENRECLSTRLLSIILSSLISISVFAFLMDSDYVVLVVFLFMFSNYFFYALIRKCLGDWLNRNDCVGKICFEENSVKRTNCVVQIADVVSIYLVGDYYQGCSLGHRDYLHNGLYSIKFLKKSGESIEFKFIVFTESEYDRLVTFFKYLYSKFTIKIVEKIGVERFAGLLLSHVRSFREIQKLKSDFRITK